MAVTLKYIWVDVFAPAPLTGNQLCVFTGADGLPFALMQKVARELNHSETTFLQRATTDGADLRVRILIPTLPLAAEVPFAGHPVLGSACVAAMQHGRPVTLRLETGAGVLPVTVTPAGEGAWEARMLQPLPRTVWSRPAAGLAPGFAAELGLQPGDLRSDLPVEAVDNGMQTVLIPLESLDAVRRAVPDPARLRERFGRDGACVLIFAPGGLQPDTQVHCRVFSPFDLVAEDPATGSANGPLGEYLVRHGVVAGPRVVSEQGYQVGRPSRLIIDVTRQGGVTEAVHVGGRVMLVGQGEFRFRR
jgi:trans-2,3-dihydro-3-hydroxyanthranilate isomerase